MISIRVSKYDLKYRDENGFYQREEWISYYDIGREFLGEVLTEEQYLAVENSYLNVIRMLYEIYPSMVLHINGLELFDEDDDRWHENDVITKEKVDKLARAVLREELWCKLIDENVEVHFGYDYYMYIVFKTNYSIRTVINFLKYIRRNNLFVEKRDVVYLD
ncbi:hypothetical protein SAMN04487861_10936 [Selenomonas ruminantium]|uniref:Uncharacterized protein n=1 Tax=Selenomonas ruminantium TaxID=971 RepID=A0A1I3E6S1_SELRU|nr:hypothetical protein [Selenomonas ruminantium]SFH94682.1 hypothetical protein SAMN04487861_10936 [Selenomonas ruminantium]